MERGLEPLEELASAQEIRCRLIAQTTQAGLDLGFLETS